MTIEVRVGLFYICFFMCSLAIFLLALQLYNHFSRTSKLYNEKTLKYVWWKNKGLRLIVQLLMLIDVVFVYQALKGPATLTNTQKYVIIGVTIVITVTYYYLWDVFFIKKIRRIIKEKYNLKIPFYHPIRSITDILAILSLLALVDITVSIIAKKTI